jgi:hypothetical protein
MKGDQAGGDPQRTTSVKPTDPESTDQRKAGLDDPRALDILTTEHWSLLSTRTLGYQEMFGRATIFTAILSAIVVALALLAQVTHFARDLLAFALVLFSVSLFIGLATFVRCVAINYEDTRWVAGMALLRHAYLQIVPGLEPYFVAGHDPGAERRSLGYGSPQRRRNLAKSLTTTSSVVAALNSVLAGTIASDLAALFGGPLAMDLTVGAVVSLGSAALHVWYAARFRRRHVPSTPSLARSGRA